MNLSIPLVPRAALALAVACIAGTSSLQAQDDDLIFADGFDPPAPVACGWDTTPGNPGIVADGGGPGSVSGLGLWGGELYVGAGAFDSVAGIAGGLGRLDTTTFAAESLGGAQQADGFTNAFVSYDAGDGEKLYVVGAFNGIDVDGTTLPNSRVVVSWDGSAIGTLDDAPIGGLDFLQTGIVYDGALFLGGSSGVVDPPQNAFLLRWDGTNWQIWLDEFEGTVAPVILASAVYDGKLYLGGRFSGAHQPDDVGGPLVASMNVIAFDGEHFSSVGGGVKRGTSPVSQVLTMATFDDGSGEALYIGGRFDQSADGTPLFAVAKWDGTALSAVGAGFPTPNDVRRLAVYDDGSGPALYAVGTFTADTAGTPIARFAKWTGEAWVEVGGGIGQNPNALQVIPGVGLAVGGSFDSVGDGVVAGSGGANALAIWRRDCR